MIKKWNSVMFDNIGAKMQKLAKILAWVIIICSLVAAVSVFFIAISSVYLLGMLLLVPVIAVAGVLIAWASTITLYGFGQLLEDVRAIRTKAEATQTKAAEEPAVNNNTNTTTEEPKQRFLCPKCKRTVYHGDVVCEYCGQKFNWSKS